MTSKPILGLVGGIGAGKSTVASAFVPFGGRTVSGDEAGHEALRQPEIQSRIREAFGDAVFDEAGMIDRRKLGSVVFADPGRRAALEAIVFPWIDAELQRRIGLLQADADCKFIVLDAAIMLETGWNRVCDKIAFVDSPLAVRIARVASRGWSAEDLRLREAAQMPLDEKRKRADAVIDNGADSASLSHQIGQILQNFAWSDRKRTLLPPGP